MTALPSLREELDRKTGEALDWLITGYSIGKLDAVQFEAGIDTLWKTVAGIANQDFAHVISVASKQCGAGAIHRRSFHHPDKAVIRQLIWTVGKDSFDVIDRICGAITGETTVDCDDAAAARDKVAKVGEVIIKKGWIEL